MFFQIFGQYWSTIFITEALKIVLYYKKYLILKILNIYIYNLENKKCDAIFTWSILKIAIIFLRIKFLFEI